MLFLGNVDYDAATLTTTFMAGSTAATVEIPINNDNVVNEEDEEFSLALNLLPTTGVRIMPGIRSTATAVIIDTSAYASNNKFYLLWYYWCLPCM